eukprot:scaffold1188_cov255-Pinguiococcus_pyrenoidosus.AAC.1
MIKENLKYQNLQLVFSRSPRLACPDPARSAVPAPADPLWRDRGSSPITALPSCGLDLTLNPLLPSSEASAQARIRLRWSRAR